MGIFSRLSDIVNSNLNSMLDKAEDPQKMIRLIIQEMEETLVEVRSGSAKLLAERKRHQRRQQALQDEAQDWADKARLALKHEREDLARAALAEQKALQADLDFLAKDLQELDTQVAALDEEITLLQQKLDEARARQQQLVRKVNSTQHRVDARRQGQRESLEKAFMKFEAFEHKIDRLEGELEAFDLGKPAQQSLQDAFKDLQTADQVEDELAQLKAAIAAEKAATPSK